MPIASVNPFSGQTVRTFEPLSSNEIDRKLGVAAAAFQRYRESSFAARAGALRQAADILLAEQEKLARLMTLEMGKPIQAARDEVTKCAAGCRYYAEHGAAHLAEEVVPSSAARSYIRYDPLGAILAIMPWNFPLWQAFRFAAPALMAGNVALLKHASNVPQCALAMEDVLRRAGFEEGVFQTLLVGSDAVPQILQDPRIAAATLTGSEQAGSEVAAAAGRNLKKMVLELGGSDPFIVMPSADLARATETGVKARCINNGQSCIAAKRFLVHHAVYDRFEREFIAGMESLRIGDPLDEDTQLGPLATADIRNILDTQVRTAMEHGAAVLTGGQPLDRPGFFYQPTVLTGVSPASPVYQEEIFGPVAMLFRVQDAAEAIRIANDTPFGLGASVWTSDTAEQQLFARHIESGQVFFNAMVASDPRLPFGGIKRSGYGRELGLAGIREFVNAKTIYLA
ncbi:MAG TPA: NAD-dependent succinate-semialdehyde dehydrogenase [Bryobacteraceae bacterium]|nr:NAD-dependent succinate-semialdehyde dehydrogenase [Bryobacteraceae bacterium]